MGETDTSTADSATETPQASEQQSGSTSDIKPDGRQNSQSKYKGKLPSVLPGGDSDNPRKKPIRRVLTLLMVALLLMWGGGELIGRVFAENIDNIDFHEFLEKAEAGKIASAKINNRNGKIAGEYTDEADEPAGKFATPGPTERSEKHDDIITENIKEVEYSSPSSSFWVGLLNLLLPILLLFLLLGWFLSRASGGVSKIMQVGNTNAKTYDKEQPGVSFEDVAGYEGVKKEITEIVDFLKEPVKFTDMGAKIPKGVLLVGPPGTGKTLIARAVAGEAEVTFLSVTGSDFMEMFVGVGASRVRSLFDAARKEGKAIIFIDEVDSIGRQRGIGLGAGHDEREQTLNQLLSELDGFEPTSGVIVIAATNRPDILDPAFLRPGRFDRQVMVPLPELRDRCEILQVHVNGKKVNDEVDLEVVAKGTPGMSGADLANLVNEAALYAVREESEDISQDHFEKARDRIILGQKRESMVLSDLEKKTVAYHEAGHAVAAVCMPNADPLHKVTIIPSGRALGVTMQLPDEEKHIYRQDFIEDSLVVRMGGRIAEELVFDIISTGANDDLVGSTDLARKMVTEWGMSPTVGPMAWQVPDMGAEGMPPQGKGISDDTTRIIDQEVERILREQEQRCRETLTSNAEALERVAKALLENETIDGAEVEKIVAECAKPSGKPEMNGLAGFAVADSQLQSAEQTEPAMSDEVLA